MYSNLALIEADSKQKIILFERRRDLIQPLINVNYYNII